MGVRLRVLADDPIAVPLWSIQGPGYAQCKQQSPGLERSRPATSFLANAALVFPLDLLKMRKRFLGLAENGLAYVLEPSPAAGQEACICLQFESNKP